MAKDKSVSGSPGRGRPSRRKASPEAFPPPSERAQEKASADSSAGSGHSPEPSPISSRFSARTAPRELENEAKREKWGLPKLTEPDKTGSYIIELNVLHAGGLAGSANEFLELYKKNVENPEGRPAVRISKSYYRCQLKDAEWKAIVHADESRDSSERAIYRLWPDFPVSATTDRSVVTVKGDAALRSFDAAGRGIVWAVLDSGVSAQHPHFGPAGADPGTADHLLLNSDVADLHPGLFSSLLI